MNKKEIYLAGSAFWGGQEFIDKLPGVIETELGVTDGADDTVMETYLIGNPDSEFLGTAECIKVTYDADVISLPLLLDAFFLTANPFSTERQINYSGGMPEAKIFFVDAADEVVADKKVAELQQGFDRAVTIAVEPLKGFREASTYARDYIDRNLGEELIIDPALADVFVKAHADEFGAA